MVRTTGNRAGLISFSTDATNPVDFALATVTTSSKTQINEQARRRLSPNGATSIGDGLAVARDQLAGRNGPAAFDPAADRRHGEPPAEDRRCYWAWPDRNNRDRLRCRRQSRRRQARSLAQNAWRPLQASWRRARTEEVLRARVRGDLRGRSPGRSAVAPAGRSQARATDTFQCLRRGSDHCRHRLG